MCNHDNNLTIKIMNATLMGTLFNRISPLPYLSFIESFFYPIYLSISYLSYLSKGHQMSYFACCIFCILLTYVLFYLLHVAFCTAFCQMFTFEQPKLYKPLTSGCLGKSY